MTVEDAGAPPAEDGEFWLFGYGQVPVPIMLSMGPMWAMNEACLTDFIGA